MGKPLEHDYQICELKCQDFVAPSHAGDYFVKVSKFIDDELEYLYNLPRFYNCDNKEDLIGHYFAGLSPHTSASIVGRLIGYGPIQALYAHPYWHAAKRRNCFPEDSKILVEVENEITRIPIKSLYDAFFDQEMKLQYGFMKSVKNRDVRVFSFDKSQNLLVKTEIKNVIKVPSTDTLVKFKLVTGREFSTVHGSVAGHHALRGGSRHQGGH